MTQLADGNSIVVGVDGSEASKAALRWAREQAGALRAEVVAVHAWEPTTSGFAPYAPASARPTAEQQREQAAELLASTVREVFGTRIGGAVRAVLVEGPPARALLDHTPGALLLALGRTAHGQFELPAIGTVGRECLRHATVPVIAVAPVTAVTAVTAAERPASPLRAVETSPLARSGAA